MTESWEDVDRQSIEKVRELETFVGDVDDILSEFLLFQFQLLEPHRTVLAEGIRTADWPAFSVSLLFDDLRGRGMIRRDIDSPDLLAAFKTIHIGLLHLWAVDKPVFAKERLVRLQMKLFSEGVKAGVAYEV